LSVGSSQLSVPGSPSVLQAPACRLQPAGRISARFRLLASTGGHREASLYGETILSQRAVGSSQFPVERGPRESGVSLRPPARCLWPLGLRRGRLHKQSPFPAGIPHHSTILSFHHSNSRLRRAGRGLGDVGRGAIVRNEPNFRRGGVWGAWTGASCTNKPNLERPAAKRGVTVNKQSQLDRWLVAPNKANLLPAPDNGRGAARSPLPARGANVQNEPNSRRAGWDKAPGTRDAGANAQNEPNFANRDRAWGTRGECAKRTQFPAHRISHHSTILSFHHSSPTPIVQNEPNLGRCSRREPHCSSIPSFQHSNPPVPVGTRPQGRGTRGNRAKRSQFLACGLRIGDRPAAGRLPCAPPRACASQSCKTKPMVPERPGMGAGCRGCEAPPESDCAKRSQFGWLAEDPEDEMCKTNPISGGRGDPSFHDSIIPVFQSDADCAKQDAPDKSRDQPNRSLVSTQKRRSESDSGTFVVGVKQSQFPGPILPRRFGDSPRGCRLHPLSDPRELAVDRAEAGY